MNPHRNFGDKRRGCIARKLLRQGTAALLPRASGALGSQASRSVRGAHPPSPNYGAASGVTRQPDESSRIQVNRANSNELSR